MIEYEKADFAANEKIIIDYKTKNMLMLPSISMVNFRFAFPKKKWEDRNIVDAYFSLMDYRIYTIAFVLLITLPILICFLENLQHPGSFKLRDLLRLYFTFISIKFFVSTKLPRKWPTRCIVGSYLLLCLILCNIFSGKITELLNASFDKDFQTVDELLKSEFKLQIPTSLRILFETDDDKYASESHNILRKIIDKSDFSIAKTSEASIENSVNLIDIIVKFKIALLGTDYFIAISEAAGGNKIGFLKSSPYSYYSAMAIRKTLPMQSVMAHLQLKINEAGIPQYQKSLGTAFETNALRIKRIKSGEYGNDEHKIITLKQIWTLFQLWATMMFFSFGIFIIELIVGNFQKLKCLMTSFYAT
jgi:hypothetical protein